MSLPLLAEKYTFLAVFKSGGVQLYGNDAKGYH